MQIYLIRHTTPLVATGICYGKSDIPVNKNFDNEFQKVLNQLPSEIDALYSSPLQRCTTLAEKIIASAGKIKHYQTAREIEEIDFGAWELKNWNDIDRAEFDQWAADYVNQPVPGGESFIELNNRVNKFIEGLLKTDYNNVAIVTHSGVIRCFISRFNNIPLAKTMNIEVNFSSVHVIKCA